MALRRHAAGVALSAALLAALAACGGGSSAADPSSPMPITRTVGSSSTPASTSPTPAVDPNSDAAIISAVKSYVSAFQTAARTANVAPFHMITTSTCPCRAGVESLANQLSSAGQRTDVSLMAQDINIQSHANSKTEVIFTLSNPPYHVKSVQGAIVGNAAASQQKVDVSFELQGQRWIAYLSS